MNPIASALAEPFMWKGNAKVTRAELDRQRKIADALRAPEGFAPKGPWSTIGALAGEGVATFKDSRAAADEQAAQQTIAEALAGGKFMDVMANDVATPQQSAVAAALYQQEQQNNDPLRQLQIEQATLDLEQQRNPAPEPPKPPQIETRYNPETGQDEKVQWNAAIGDWEPFGGQKAPDAPLISGPLIDNGGADTEFYKAGATARGKVFADLEAAGIEAQSKIGQINQLEQFLSSAPQGVEGAWKQMAGEIGLPIDGVSDIQAAQALINKLVPEQRAPGTGPMSDADLALFKASLPRIINQPGGNALIIQTLKAVAVYEQQVGEIASAVLNKEITPAEGRAAMAAVQNPLELFRKGGGSASDKTAVPQGVDPTLWENMTDEERALWN